MIINLRKCADWARWKVPLPRWKSQLKRAKTASGQTEMAKFYQHLNPVKQKKNTHKSCVMYTKRHKPSSSSSLETHGTAAGDREASAGKVCETA
jgi:hypothetical protein